MEELKKLIEYNFYLNLFLDSYDRLYIEHNGIRVHIEYINNKPYLSAYKDKEIHDDFLCENNETVLYALLKYYKDVHRWGDFHKN